MIDVWIEMYVSSLTDIDSFLKKYDELWGTFDIHPHAGMQVLDVACGPAPRTLALARQHAGVQVTLLDWERILKTALNFARTLEVDRQVTIKKGDLWSTDFGSNQFNLVFLGNITHFFSPEENIRLFQKTYIALIPAGVIAINALRHEYPLPLDPELRYYALSKGGAAYNFEEYRNMLEQAGFTNVMDVAQQPIRADKP